MGLSTFDEIVLREFGLIVEYGDMLFINNKYFDVNSGIIKWNILNKFLSNQLTELKESLIIYLKEFVPILHVDNKPIKRRIEKKLKDIQPNHIITFNYTDYYKLYYDCKSINHVHGDLINRKIVLGYEDDFPNNIEYIYFKKYFQRIQNKLKPLNKSDEMFNVKDEFFSSYTDENSYLDNIIYFYGLSFDITDIDYIKEIFDAPNIKKIYIYYYDENDYDRKIINLIKIFGKDRILLDRYNSVLEFIKI